MRITSPSSVRNWLFKSLCPDKGCDCRPWPRRRPPAKPGPIHPCALRRHERNRQVVQDGDPLGISSGANQIPNAFVDCRQTHAIRIRTPSRLANVLCRRAAFRAGDRTHHHRVEAHRREVHQWFGDRTALHFVVILSNDPVLGSQVRMAHQSGKQIGRIHGRVARKVPAGCKRGFTLEPWDAVMQEGHGKTADFHIVVTQDQFAIWRAKHAKVTPLRMRVQMSAKASIFSSGTARTMRSCASLIQISVGVKPSYFRGALQLNFGTSSSPIIADRTGESAGTAIGHGPERTSHVVVPRFKQSVEELFLNNWISNLHRMTELIGVGIRQFRRRKCCAVNAISASPAASTMMRSPGLGSPSTACTRGSLNHAAEHKRVSDVPIIEPHPPVQCGDTHTVAVVTHPGDHLLQDAPRRQAAGRYVCQIRVGHAEDIGGGDGLGPKTVPMTSRMRPPIPVAAPPYGSIAGGGCGFQL